MASHYCAVLDEEVRQCAIHDGNGRDAKLVDVEYVLRERLFLRLFLQLREAEKAFWHSPVREVKAGLLVAPGIPESAENEVMRQLAETYGKTWHIWHAAKDALPLGVPKLMMAFAADGQVDPASVRQRDERLGLSSAGKRNRRGGYPVVFWRGWRRRLAARQPRPGRRSEDEVRVPASAVAGMPAPR